MSHIYLFKYKTLNTCFPTFSPKANIFISYDLYGNYVIKKIYKMFIIIQMEKSYECLQ